MGRWSISFRSTDFNGGDRRDHLKRGRRQAVSDLDVPLPGDGQHHCPRGAHCASSTRDEDGTWHPLLINSVFCVADESAIVNAIPGLPGSYERLAGQMTDPLRSKGPGPGSRRPPGSRVLLGAGDDALLREAAAVLNGWAARVRAVPGIRLSPRRRLPGTQAGVEENCGVLATFTTQLLALPPGPTLRTWEYPPGREGASAPAARAVHQMGRPPARQASAAPPVPCRRCGTFVTSSPSGKHWWPAVCTHPVAVPARWAENPDGTFTAVAWACAECSTPLRGATPRQRAACAHEPSAVPPAAPGGIPADIEDQVAGLEVVRAGDGWVTCITDLSGADAGLDVLDLAARFKRRLQEAAPPPEDLDGIPCRECDAMASLVRADIPADPAVKAPWSRCTSCGHVMTRAEFDEWTDWYDGFVKRGGAPSACRRCELGRHQDCYWDFCSCRGAGHAAA
jgi:hypothetical protein